MIREAIKHIDISSTLKKEFPNTPFKLTENKEFLVLMIVVVKYKKRHEGIGTKFMKRLIELAKKSNKDIYLSPDDSYAGADDMNKSQLIKWYKKLGFEKKQRDDFRSWNTMCYYIEDN